MSNPSQFALNSAATAMNNADALLRDIATRMIADAWADSNFVREIVETRRDLQRCSDLARAVAKEIKNARVREMGATGATSLKEIA